ncbi:DUF4349 domain-containing protein [Demequina capsici]|uniref:DUF4349 domain-containing protein n=1 Tax=Demequina capsici TaxID=3075620 RepID=A0AA96F6G4_9MICO|nr:DUF4349 domain-containing protein [Demequina sp. OYTSA14]WNM24214.1 DUF4349 domain-containing protein [Demequina sp. OYTSA14]
MGTQLGGYRRQARRAGVIIGLLAMAGMLTACSGSGASDSAGSYAGGDTEAAYDGDSAAVTDTTDTTSTSSQDDAVIVTGSVYMTVDDPIGTADTVVTLVESSGGRIDGRSETAPSEGYGGAAMLTLRIPADQVDAVVAQLRTLGTIDELSTQSRNVGDEVTDLDARISTLRASTTRIEGLLDSAKDIDDIIALEDELASRQAELQSLEAQQRGLSDQVALSTIELSLTTEPVDAIIIDDSPSNFWDGIVSGWNGLVTVVSAALVVLGVLLPWALAAGLVTVAGLAVVRLVRSRRTASAVDDDQPAPASAATTSSSVD